MNNLEEIQQFFKEKEKQEKHEVLNLLVACNVMLTCKGNKKAVKTFLQTIIHFYGVRRTIDVLNKYNFKQLKRYLQNKDVLKNKIISKYWRQ